MTNKNKIKLAILGGSTTGLIKKDLIEYFHSKKIKIEIYESDYNQYIFEGLNPSPKLIKFKPDFIFIHTSSENIKTFPDLNDSDAKINEHLENSYKIYEKIWNNLTNKFNCFIIQNNFEYLKFANLGNLESVLSFGKNNFINNLNIKFNNHICKTKNIFINDINYLSSKIGLNNWSNDSFYFNYKYTLSHDSIKILSKNVSSIVLSLIGKSKKCLVLDFDNTIWGGLVGEVGGDKIEIGNGTPAGEIFLRFQKYVVDLNKRGIILVGCTKNEYKNAISGLANKNNFLNKNHFSLIKANWNNKADNIRKISKELNIGLDSLVFLDDSKFEREQVKKELPMIEVPELGSDPEDFLKILDSENYFETTNISKEDTKRISYYKENVKREEKKENYSNINQYLKSLKMRSLFSYFNNKNIERIHQLINKTNQFNLTTYRYTLKQVISFMKSKKHICLSANLSDKFGDNGLITILIAKIEKNNAEILIWLMSCRVFNRDMEIAMFDRLIESLKKKKITSIYGKYIKTKKNDVVKDLYKSLGFRKFKNMWKYEIPKKYKNKNIVIKPKSE